MSNKVTSLDGTVWEEVRPPSWLRLSTTRPMWVEAVAMGLAVGWLELWGVALVLIAILSIAAMYARLVG